MRIKRILSALLALCLTLALLPVSALAVEGDSTSGTFTVAAMNVDGLPVKILGIDLNKGGPGSDGTKAISAKLAEMNWDIIGVSEDFNYNDELMSSLSSSYNAGTYRGGVSWLTNDTDGLNLLWKKSISVTGESYTAWNEHYSTGIANTGNGADGMIDKGYRYYEAEVAPGVCVDVYILHMDADSDQGDIDARHSQLTQLANAIKASDNGNPIIVMGDTNCRYTREQLKTLFIDAIDADERFTIQDPWVELNRNGVYPDYPSGSIMVDDYGYQQGEIVDKVFYINNTDSNVTLTADSYRVEEEFKNADGVALADHYPVVVQLTYTVEQPEVPHTHSYTVQVTQEPTCTENGVKTFTCACGDSYTELIPALGHDYQKSTETEATCTEDGSVTYICSHCGDSYTKTIPALGHDYQKSTETEATCTEDGSVTYTCSRCGDSYDKSIPATGHSYENGVCTVCGEPDPDASTGEERPGTYTLGEIASEVESGKQYAIVYPSSTPYVLSHEDRNPSALKEFDVETGEEISADMVWTITENGTGGYLISAEVDGETQYLARTKSMTNSGYKITLQDNESAWKIQEKDGDMVRISSLVGSASYYALRPYTLKTGWITSVKVSNVQLYEIEG